MREGSSANTAASHRAAMRYWAAWFELRYGRRFALPLPETAVVQFVVDHARRQTEQGLTSEMPAALDQELVRLKVKGRLGPPGLNTVLQRVSVLSKAHDTLGLLNPCRAQGLRDLLARTRRAHARGAAPARKPALTRERCRRCWIPATIRCADCATGRYCCSPGPAAVGAAPKSCAPPSRNAARRGRFSLSAAPLQDQPGGRRWPRTPSRSWERRRGPCRPGWMPAASRKARCSAGSGAAMCWASHWPPPPCAISCASAASWRAWTSYSAHSLRSGFITEAGRQQVPLGDAMADGPRQRGHGHTTTAPARRPR